MLRVVGVKDYTLHGKKVFITRQKVRSETSVMVTTISSTTRRLGIELE